MRRFILSSLELVSQIAIFLILVMGLINGATTGGAGGVSGAIAGGTMGFLTAFVFCVVVFGAIFLLLEIAENTRRTADSIDAFRKHQHD
jgi:hypothetical protein